MLAPYLETERLILRSFSNDDTESLAKTIFKDPKVTLTLPQKPQTPKEQEDCARGYIFSYKSSWYAHGYGGWAVCSRDQAIAPEGELLGFCGFMLGDREGKLPELGFGYASSSWGKGIGYEAAIAAVNWFFAQGKFTDFYACVDSFNIGSIRILEKLGMKYVGDEDLWGSVAKGEGLLPVYTLNRKNYQ